MSQYLNPEVCKHCGGSGWVGFGKVVNGTVNQFAAVCYCNCDKAIRLRNNGQYKFIMEEFPDFDKNGRIHIEKH